jgi:hypothetical protein
MAKKSAAKKAAKSASKSAVKKAAPSFDSERSGAMISMVGGMPVLSPNVSESVRRLASRVGFNPVASKPATRRPQAVHTESVAAETVSLPSDMVEKLKKAVAQYGPELMRTYPDIVAVGYGLKISKGLVTPEPAICVQVIRKFDDKDVVNEQRMLPTSIGGFSIDVITRPRPRNTVVRNPGRGMFTNNPQVRDSIGQFTRGTLGAIVFVDGYACALSNIHVWEEVADSPIYFPFSTGGSNVAPAGYVFRSARSYDACLAVLDGDSVSYDNRIDFRGALGLGNIRISTSATPPTGFGNQVAKCGAMTGVTVGTVAQAYTDFFRGRASRTYYTVVPVAGGGEVSRGGDSGSIVVDSAGRAVGLLWGGERDDTGASDYFAMDPMPEIQSELGFSW